MHRCVVERFARDEDGRSGGGVQAARSFTEWGKARRALNDLGWGHRNWLVLTRPPTRRSDTRRGRTVRVSAWGSGSLTPPRHQCILWAARSDKPELAGPPAGACDLHQVQTARPPGPPRRSRRARPLTVACPRQATSKADRATTPALTTRQPRRARPSGEALQRHPPQRSRLTAENGTVYAVRPAPAWENTRRQRGDSGVFYAIAEARAMGTVHQLPGATMSITPQEAVSVVK
jgi:hypothetical protein